MKQIRANMAGMIVDIRSKPGDIIQEGMEIGTLESMKMQIPITADIAGKVLQVHVAKDGFVNEGDPILTLE